MNIKTAIQEDIDVNYFAAIDIYEQLIDLNVATLSVFSNLSFIYWRFAAHVGFRSSHNISDEWIERGDINYKIVINKGLEKYPESVELRFLSKYFLHRLGIIDFSRQECEEIIRSYRLKSLLPYFYLYLFDDAEFKQQRDLLLKECQELPTTKNRYIRAILA